MDPEPSETTMLWVAWVLQTPTSAPWQQGRASKKQTRRGNWGVWGADGFGVEMLGCGAEGMSASVSALAPDPSSPRINIQHPVSLNTSPPRRGNWCQPGSSTGCSAHNGHCRRRQQHKNHATQQPHNHSCSSRSPQFANLSFDLELLWLI